MSAVPIEETGIWQDVLDIVKKGPPAFLYAYVAEIHTEKEDFNIWAIKKFEAVRNYLNETGEYINFQFEIGLGDYIARLYPYRDFLEVSIKRKGVKNTDGLWTEAITDGEVIRYRAIFKVENNPPVYSGDIENHDPGDMNNLDVVKVQVQLYELPLTALRITTSNWGAARNITPLKVMETILVDECRNVLVNGRPSIDIFDIVEPDNKEPIPAFVLPHGYPVLRIPSYLQENLTGVYGRGIGTFVQRYRKKMTLFVYPTYDYERFNTDIRRVTFYIIPQDRLQQLDNTYWEDVKNLKVIITGPRKYEDGAGLTQQNAGGGFRSADAQAFMTKPVKIRPDGQPIGARSNLNREVVAEDRKDGLNYAPVVSRPDANPYNMRSAVLNHAMGQLDLVWENSNPALLYPGMPAECIFISQGEPVIIKGTLLLVRTLSQADKSNVMRNVTHLSLCVQNRTDVVALPKAPAAYDKKGRT